MNIFVDHEQRLLPAHAFELPSQCLESFLFLYLRAHGERREAISCRDRQQVPDELNVCFKIRRRLKHRSQSVDVDTRCVVPLQSRRAFKLHDDGMERAVRVVGRRKVAQGRVRLGPEPAFEFRDKSRLADARLAPKQHDATLPARSLPPAAEQQFQFFLATY